MSREDWLRGVLSRLVVRSFEQLVFEVKVYRDLAVVRSAYRQEATYEGSDNGGSFSLMYEWVRRDGRWRVVAGISSRL